eukprot:g3012.t1
MGKKKGKKKKGKKKKGGGGGGADNDVFELPFDMESIDKYVTIHPIMHGWNHARSLWPREGIQLRSDARLYTLKKLIMKKHGSISELRIWHEKDRNCSTANLTPENCRELEGDMTTLEELGLEGEGRPADDKAMEAFINHMTGKVAPPPEDAPPEEAGQEQGTKEGNDEETAANMETDDDENVPDSPRALGGTRILYDFKTLQQLAALEVDAKPPPKRQARRLAN